MKHTPFPPLRSLHGCAGLLAAAIVSLSGMSGLLNLFASVDADPVFTLVALQPAALTTSCAAAGVGPIDGRCADPAPAVLAGLSPFDDADTR